MSEFTLKAIEVLLDQKLEAQTKELKTHSEELQGELARMTSAGFVRTEQRFDQLEEILEVKQDVLTLKRQMLEIRAALHLSV